MLISRTIIKSVSAFGVAAALAGGTMQAAQADETVRIAQQRGLTYLTFIVMEHEQLIEQIGEEAGLGTVTVEWTRFGGGTPMNDALLAGRLDFAATGLPSFAILWDRAQDVLPIRGVTSYGAAPLYLVTRNENVQTLADFGENDRIAVPAVRSSAQAIMLQMAAQEQLGAYDELDHLTVSLSHPDAMVALLSPGSEISAHFGAPPYIFQELEEPGMRSVLTNYQIFGGPVSNGILYTTETYFDENAEMIDVIMRAMGEAIDLINSDAMRAAEIYLEVSGEDASVEEIHEIISHPGMIYELTPRNTFTYVDFMHSIGSIDREPESWRDLFFDVAHGMPGS